MTELSNALLQALPPNDISALKPFLRHVSYQQKHILFRAGDPVATVYFPAGGVISLVIDLASGASIEAAMVGRDGVVGASSALDGRTASNRGVVQLAGDLITCDAKAFRNAALQSRTLLTTIISFEQALFGQAQQSAACIAAHRLEERFCRWLLRSRDLAGTDTLDFTQEYLAEMLGVTRTSVTLVAHSLQRAGMIKYARGKVQILDVEGLREATCECYQAVRSQQIDQVSNIAPAE